MYQQVMNKLGTLERKHACLWTECQRCQESLHDDVLCSKYVTLPTWS